MPENTNQRVKDAIQALRGNKPEKARKLILAEIKENPSNLDAWLWALEVAANEKEKRTILRKILLLDPAHEGALRYIKILDKKASAVLPHEYKGRGVSDKRQPADDKKSTRTGGIFRFFTDLPPSCGFIVIFVIIITIAFFYFRVNTSFFGLVGTDFDQLVISNSYELISADDMYWEVQFEGVGESKYIGTVRHAAPIRNNDFRILTHNILVTTADFANPDLVDTSVIDNKFFWKSPGINSPNGSINLIHAIPSTKAIYQEMLKIQPWDIVKITGREIYTVKAYESDENFLGTWLDAGCNTLLVNSVSILKPEAQQ